MLIQIVQDTLTTAISEVVNTAVAIHEVTGGGSIIQGVDNGVVGSMLTMLVAGIIRYFEKRKIKRKNKE